MKTPRSTAKHYREVSSIIQCLEKSDRKGLKPPEIVLNVSRKDVEFSLRFYSDEYFASTVYTTFTELSMESTSTI